VRVDETCDSVDDVDVIPRELVADDVDLAFDHLAGPEPEILHGDVFLEPVAVSVDGPLADAGEVDDGLAEGLRRDRPAVDGDATDRPPLDDRGAPAELRSLDGRLLPGRARADGEEVVVVAVFHGLKPYYADAGSTPREAE